MKLKKGTKVSIVRFGQGIITDINNKVVEKYLVDGYQSEGVPFSIWVSKKRIIKIRGEENVK